MKIKMKLTESRRLREASYEFDEEEFDTSEIDTIPVAELEEIFKYFHLSDKKLNGNEPFTFNPRVPKNPFENDGHVIEFTEDFKNVVTILGQVKNSKISQFLLKRVLLYSRN